MILCPAKFLEILKSELVRNSFDRLFVRIMFSKILVLLFKPVKTSDSLRLAMIIDDPVAQVAKFPTKWDCFRIKTAMIDLVRLFQDFLGLEVLIRRYVIGMKWIFWSDSSVFNSSFLLIAILGISFLKVIQNFLLNSNPIATLPFLCFFSCYLKINLGSKGSELIIETFLASQRMARVENIKWFTVNLVSTIYNLVVHGELRLDCSHFPITVDVTGRCCMFTVRSL